MEDREKIISDAEKIRIAAIDDVKARQDSTEEYRLYRRIQEDKKAAANYEIYNVQCTINNQLNNLVRFIKNYKDNIYRVYDGTRFYELVGQADFNIYMKKNIIPTIETEVIDSDAKQKLREERINKLCDLFYKCNIQELRKILFNCHGLEPVPFPKPLSNGSIDVLECYAAGVNPESYLLDNDKWFLDNKDYSISDISSIVTNKEINGYKIATKINKTVEESEIEEIIKPKKI